VNFQAKTPTILRREDFWGLLDFQKLKFNEPPEDIQALLIATELAERKSRFFIYLLKSKGRK